MNQPTEPEFLDDVGLKKPDRSNPIPKDKAQLIALLQKQPTIHVIDVIEGKPAFLAEKIRVLKDTNLTLIIIKSR
ncbi:MAG: hypothetical protein K9J47_03435 [Sulfuritalea sp.]|nr:hypothetical protein [Polynucleobacter sp.]MCF8187808.1 hypothetical protein [Sulfuritalea sp.]